MHLQLVEDEGEESNELYGIPERMVHNRTISRVMDTPRGQTTNENNDNSPRLRPLLGQDSSCRGGSEGYVQVPRSPLDAISSTRINDQMFPETVPDSFLSTESEVQPDDPQSSPESFIATQTQRLPTASQPDHPEYKMKLLGTTIRRLEKKAAATARDGRANVDGGYVDCQCKFSGEEGEMVCIPEIVSDGVLC